MKQGSEARCPGCGAPVPPEMVGTAPAIECRYCGTTIVLAPGMPHEASSPKKGGPTPRSSSSGLFIGIAAVGLAGAGVAIYATAAQDDAATGPESNVWHPPAVSVRVSPPPSASASEPPSAVAVSFGEEGDAPGQLRDPRGIAVDRQGNVFVANFGPAKLQMFDEEGSFQRSVDLGDAQGKNLTSIATDYSARVYAVLGGDIHQYAIDTGERVAVFEGSKSRHYRSIAIDSSNSIYALALNGKETDVVKLNAQGKVLETWAAPLRKGFENSGMLLGNPLIPPAGGLYVLLSRQGAMLVLDREGQFVDRVDIGSMCKATQGNPAVLDDKGDLIVGSNDALTVCGANGKLKEEIPLPKSTGSIRALALAPSGRVYATLNTDQVIGVDLGD